MFQLYILLKSLFERFKGVQKRNIGPKWLHFWFTIFQSLRGAPRERCSENMQQIYKRTTMPKCDFNNFIDFNNLLKWHLDMGSLL